MKRITALTVPMGALAIALVACSSGAGDSSDSTPGPGSTAPTATTVPIAPSVPTPVPPNSPEQPNVIFEDAEVDPKTAALLGIGIHQTRWGTRPSSNYKFGFQWNVGEFAYQRANVVVWVIQNEIERVVWAGTAAKTDGTEPPGFVVPEEPNVDEYFNINGLFELIMEAIESDPAAVSLAFDSVFGYPTLADIQFVPGNDHERVWFFATQLVPIPGPPEEFGIIGDTSPGVK